jgi:chromosomal replication initiator protein
MQLQGRVTRALVRRIVETTVEVVLAELKDETGNMEPFVRAIRTTQEVVAKEYGLRRGHLLSESRVARIARARQVAMYLVRTLWLFSLPEIGRNFGNRDHTTVLHAVRKIERLLETDQELKKQVKAFKKKLKKS